MKERNMVILKPVIEELDLVEQSEQATYTGLLKHELYSRIYLEWK